MFQDINVAKSAPFALLTIYPKIPVSPQNIQNAPNFGKLREIRRPFLYLDHEEWKTQILQKIMRNSLNSPITTANNAKSM